MLSISPTRGQEQDFLCRNREMAQPLLCQPWRHLAHGRQETKLQPGPGPHRQVTTSQPQSMFSMRTLS
jgi:hypothetical protein